MLKRYRYAGDPICLASWALYGCNRFLVPWSMKGPFLRFHFNDVLFIPAVLPLMLWVHRKLGLRHDDAPPRGDEVWLHLVVWSVAAEVVAPRLSHRATGDVWDVVAYAAGALGAQLLWRFS